MTILITFMISEKIIIMQARMMKRYLISRNAFIMQSKEGFIILIN